MLQINNLILTIPHLLIFFHCWKENTFNRCRGGGMVKITCSVQAGFGNFNNTVGITLVATHYMVGVFTFGNVHAYMGAAFAFKNEYIAELRANAHTH